METTLNQETDNFVENCMGMANDIMKLHARKAWIDYDEEADVIYMSFRKPQRANKTIEINEDVLLRKDNNEIVGITIMNASTKKSA